MRNVIDFRRVGVGRHSRTRAARRTVWIVRRQIEAAHEAAPGDVSDIQKIADVLAGKQRCVGGAGADVVGGIHVVDQRITALRVRHVVAGVAVCIEDDLHAVGLAGDDFQRTRRGRAVTIGAGVVAHREVLGVVPERRNGIAVVIAHDRAGRAERAGAAGRAFTCVKREQVSRAVVFGLLLRRIGVALVSRGHLGDVQTERIGGARAVLRIQKVRVGGQKTGMLDRIDLGLRNCLGVEGWLADRIGGMRLGAEVVVERNVLTVDDDHMFDGRGCRIGVHHWFGERLRAGRECERRSTQKRREAPGRFHGQFLR